MEYSVYDLIKILLKKWYVIVLSVCLVAGASTVAAKRSYDVALRQYEEYVSRVSITTQDSDIGTMCVTYLYDYEVVDVSRYVSELSKKVSFFEKVESELAVSDVYSVAELIENAYAKGEQDAMAILTSAKTMEKVQAEVDLLATDSAITVSDCLTIEVLEGRTVSAVISGVEEAEAQKIIEIYAYQVSEIAQAEYGMDASLSMITCSFSINNPVQLTEEAQLAQIVMQKPTAEPAFTRTVATAGMLGFVLACLAILIATFVKDTYPATKKET